MLLSLFNTPKPSLALPSDPRYWLFFARNFPRPRTLLRLQEQVGSLETLFTTKACTLSKLKLPEHLISSLQNPEWQEIDRELTRLKAMGGFLVTLNSDSYPYLLSQINSPPLCLYGLGTESLLASPQLAIVGSRKPTVHGIESAYQFARELAETGIVITSGLAIGIDGVAHQGALAAPGRTIAVTATGLDIVYPHRHNLLSRAIVESGAVITEHPLGTRPRANYFPQRNRIIAGLSLGVLVVEAAVRSGSLITAYNALSENRDVYALPGAIQSQVAAGCHQLLREGAKLVTSPKDILEEWPEPVTLKDEDIIKSTVSISGQRLEGDKRRVYDGVGFGRTAVDTLVAITGFSVAKLTTLLCELELTGLVVRVPGGYIKIKGTQYERKRA